jgi:hypothetical protein
MFDKQEQHHELASDLLAIERHLRELTLTAPQVDRDRLMYLAGVAAGQSASASESARLTPPAGIRQVLKSRQWLWPTTAAMMTAATLLLGSMLVWQNRSPSVVQIGTNSQPVRQSAHHPQKAISDCRDQLAADEDHSWRIRPAATGYLGVRYIALTQGITAFEPDYQATSAGGDSWSDVQQTQPATAGRLMDELLPASTGTPRPRS